jgi:hypothetical protein
MLDEDGGRAELRGDRSAVGYVREDYGCTECDEEPGLRCALSPGCTGDDGDLTAKIHL